MTSPPRIVDAVFRYHLLRRRYGGSFGN